MRAVYFPMPHAAVSAARGPVGVVGHRLDEVPQLPASRHEVCGFGCQDYPDSS